MKDLYNNEVGRQLAADPANHNRSDEEVIREALESGKLRITPFNVVGSVARPGPRNRIYEDETYREGRGDASQQLKRLR